MYKKAVFFVTIEIILIAGCSPKLPVGNNVQVAATTVDYSNINNWAAHPWKIDPSDRYPNELRNKLRDSIADVFFIYPTTYTKAKTSGINASINDDNLNKKTDESSILHQATAFNQHARVFAPRYRQAHYSIFLNFSSKSSQDALDTAYADVRNAFLYYLKTYNIHRPLIIAAHSQGTLHAARLIKEFIEGKDLAKNFVCAYLLGMPIHADYFATTPVCKDSTQTGCFVSWRTFRRGYVPNYILNEKADVLVVNPLTWKTKTDFAPAELNHGGILKNFDKIVPAVVDAEVHGNVLWTSLPKFFGNVFLPTKNYHIADVNFFWLNIRENVEARLYSFLKSVR